MKKYMFSMVLFLAGQYSVFAQTQAQRADTILLSVYNNGLKFRLTPATFAPQTPAEDMLAEMVMGLKGKEVNEVKRLIVQH